MLRPTLCLPVCLLCLAFTGCAGQRARSTSPQLDAAQQGPAAEIASLDAQQLQVAPGTSPQQELAALHLLYDLLDQARFGQDARARDKLWEVLPVGAKRRGTQAFRDAASGILSRAWDLESLVQSTPESAWGAADQQSLAQLIMLLSIDVNPSADAEQVEDLALALRTLGDDAGSRIRDNLDWRIYDLGRALVQALVDAPAPQRTELFSFAKLLVGQEEEQAQGPLRTLDTWIAPWLAARKRLRQDPRWALVVQARDPQDNALHEQLALASPSPRRSDWGLARIDSTGLDPDPMDALIRIADASMKIDGRPLSSQSELGPQLAQQLAVTGRSTATVAADRMTPAPWLHKGIHALAKSGIEEVVLAGYPTNAEPPPKGFHAALVGVRVSFESELVPAQLYIAGFSSGYRIGWNQALLPELLPDLDALAMWVSRYRFAYPTQHVAQVAFAQDLALEQRLGLLVRLRQVMGPTARLSIVQSDQETPTLWPDSPALPKDLQTRARWRWPRGSEAPPAELETLNGQEPAEAAVASTHRFIQSLQVCLAELGRTRVKRRKLSAEFRFRNGALASWQWSGPAATLVGPQATARVNACVQELASQFVLPEARAPWTVGVAWTLPAAAKLR